MGIVLGYVVGTLCVSASYCQTSPAARPPRAAYGAQCVLFLRLILVQLLCEGSERGYQISLFDFVVNIPIRLLCFAETLRGGAGAEGATETAIRGAV